MSKDSTAEASYREYASNQETLRTQKPDQPSWIRRHFAGIRNLALAGSIVAGGAGVVHHATGVELGGPLPVGATVDRVGSEIIKGAETVFGTKSPEAAQDRATDNEYKEDQPFAGINTTRLEITKGVNIRINPRVTYLLDSGGETEEQTINWDDIETVNREPLHGSSEFFLDNALVFKGQNAHNSSSLGKAPWALVIIGKKDGSQENGFIFLGGETANYVKGGKRIEWVEPNKSFTATDSNGNTISPSEYGKVTLPSPTD